MENWPSYRLLRQNQTTSHRFLALARSTGAAVFFLIHYLAFWGEFTTNEVHFNLFCLWLLFWLITRWWVWVLIGIDFNNFRSILKRYNAVLLRIRFCVYPWSNKLSICVQSKALIVKFLVVFIVKWILQMYFWLLRGYFEHSAKARYVELAVFDLSCSSLRYFLRLCSLHHSAQFFHLSRLYKRQAIRLAN